MTPVPINSGSSPASLAVKIFKCFLSHLMVVRENKTDVFDKFKIEGGNFKDCIREDAEGLLSLFEASHYGMPCETGLEAAKTFCVERLKSLIGKMEIKSAQQIQQSMEVPIRWRMPRLETRNFIDHYESDSGKNPVLLELAKLDYNLTQSVHQKELQELTK